MVTILRRRDAQPVEGPAQGSEIVVVQPGITQLPLYATQHRWPIRLLDPIGLRWYGLRRRRPCRWRADLQCQNEAGNQQHGGEDTL
jgi:hypothetical protein